MTLGSGETLGRYKIIEALGSGGMGEVYLAEDPALRRRVAIKVLPETLLQDPARRQRFLHEARAAAAVDHPNVVHIYEVVEEPGGRIYLAMQHVEGKTLRKKIGTEKPDLDACLAIAEEMADAMAAAHARGIIHRDIKPDNVMIDTGGHARLLDFGLARALEPEGPPSTSSEAGTVTKHATEPGALMGTIAYMSPEQAMGEALDGRTDIFSFGVTLYEMTTGRHPFVGRTQVDTTDALLHRDPKPIGEILPGAPPQMEWVLSKMLAKNREDRYQSARDLLVDLRKVRHSTGGWKSGPASAAAASGKPPAAGKVSTARLQTALRTTRVAATLIALGALAFVVLWRSNRGQRPVPDLAAPPGAPAVPSAGVPGAPASPQRPVPATASPMRVAVLPFENVRRDPRVDFLGYAIADALISKLSYIQSLTVRPSSYIQKYRDRIPDPKEAAAELAVDHIVTGSLLTEGNSLRISVQFVDLDAGAVKWRDTVDAKLDNLLAAQEQVADRVVSGMKVQLSPEESQRLRRDVPSDPEAYALFLRARAMPRTLEGDRQALQLVKESLQREDDHAPAWAELGWREYSIALYGGRGEEYDLALQHFRKALEINPDFPPALSRVSTILTEQGKHEEAYQRLRRWLAVTPGSGEAHFSLSYLFRYTGLLEESKKEGRTALELLPGNPTLRSAGNTYTYAGDFNGGEIYWAVDASGTVTLLNRAFAAACRGDRKQARALYERMVDVDPNAALTGFARGQLALFDGDRARARSYIEKTVAALTKDPEQWYWGGAFLVEVGEKEKGLDLIDRAVRSGFYPYTFFEIDPRLGSVRSDARYRSILAEARGRSETFRAFVAANP